MYAQRLSEHGFITLDFDVAHRGESGGEPRYPEEPAIRVEDFRCVVDFLSNYPLVDENRIGALGVCAGGGYAVNAAQTERRIKAVAGVSSVDLGAFLRDGLGGVVSLAERQKTLEEVGKQRTRKARGGPIMLVPIVADSADEPTDETPRLNR